MAIQTQVTRAASAERDSFLDALRAIAIIRVVVWHTYGAFWISYFIASLPVMFFVAGSLMAGSLQRAGAISVLYRRFRRLLLPLWLMAAAAIATMAVYDHASDSFAASLYVRDLVWWIFPVWDPSGSDWGITWWAPLWYLRCLTWLLLASPLLLFCWRQLGLIMLALPLIGLAISEYQLQAGAPLPWQVQDLSLYAFFWLLGFAYNDGLLTRLGRGVSALLCLAFAAAAAAWALTQDVPGDIVNASYPLHLLVAMAWLCGALAMRGAIATFALRQRLAAAIYWVNERALTIYLWHAAGLFVMYQILWTTPHSQLTRDLLALPIVVSVTFLAILAFGWAEDLAAGRRARLSPSPTRPPAQLPRRASAPLSLAASVLAGAGLAAALLSLASIIERPDHVVQPTAQTVPASGVGLQIRTERAEVAEEPPPPPPKAPESPTPVTAAELQAEIDAWQAQWRLGATVSLKRYGETWTGAVGRHDDGTFFLQEEEYWIGSVTKTFTVALIMRLADRGLLSLDDPVSNFVPAFPDAELFTVRQLIQHTSGLIVGDETPYEAMVSAAHAGLQSEPGTRFEYSRVGYYILGLIIEDRLGVSYTQALREELLQPLGLVATRMDEELQPLGYSTHPYATLAAGYAGVSWSSGGLHRELPPQNEYRGVYWSSGGLFSTTHELARWATELWGSQTVVTAESLAAMTSFLDADFAFSGLGTYAFCPCWLDGDRLHGERWGHLGATGAIEYAPADEVALAMHVSSIVTEPNVIEAMDDLSVRLRGLVRGRPLAIDASLGVPLQTARRGCSEIGGGSYLDYLERLWYLSNCVVPGEGESCAPESSDPLALASDGPPELVLVPTETPTSSSEDSPGQTAPATQPCKPPPCGEKETEFGASPTLPLSAVDQPDDAEGVADAESPASQACKGEPTVQIDADP